MLVKVALFVAFIGAANAACDNQCSGHGSCQMDDVCKCYDNWGVGLSYDSGDCSERICPFELAWVDTPSATGKFHKYAECAGRGICQRDTGECTCFDGYEGKACQRTSCPNDCSGHGTCEFIQDLGFAATWNDYTPKYFSDDRKTFPYKYWDNQKTRGCVCDALYGDVDCSKRLCPYGTDVLDQRDNLLISTAYQVQTLYFLPSNVKTTPSALYNDPGTNTKLFGSDASLILQGQTFALTFKSRLNETFTTIPIVYDPYDIPDLVHDIQLALLNLPNRVIDGITVAASSSTTFLEKTVTANTPTSLGALYNSGAVQVNITFTGNSVQGPQHLIIVEDYECAAGCTPKITGLNLQTRYNRYTSNVTEVKLADYNSYECGRRGKCDYTTGECSCFTGYTGDNCNTLTTLV